MKTNIEVTFDEVARALRSLAHDLADRAEAGYLPRTSRAADFRHADGPKVGPALDRGVSHDGAGR
jgi:hypothetical protein